MVTEHRPAADARLVGVHAAARSALIRPGAARQPVSIREKAPIYRFSVATRKSAKKPHERKRRSLYVFCAFAVHDIDQIFPKVMTMVSRDAGAAPTGAAVRLLLFDLGGVLIHYDPIGPLTRLVPGAQTRDAVTRRWAGCEALRRLETGRCAPAEFAAAVVGEFRLNVTPEEFLENFALWDRGPMTGAVELLRALRGGYRLACLSNNNAVHWSRLCRVFRMDREFDATFLSHEIGVMKPDCRAYEHVLAAENVAASDVVFIDDNAENVAAARDLGIHAFRCVGIEAVRRCLEELLGDPFAVHHESKPT